MTRQNHIVLWNSCCTLYSSIYRIPPRGKWAKTKLVAFACIYFTSLSLPICLFVIPLPFHWAMSSDLGERVYGSKGNKRRNATTKLEFLQKTLLAPFNHKKSDSARILSDCPCCISSRLLSADSLDILHFENSGPCDNDPSSDQRCDNRLHSVKGICLCKFKTRLCNNWQGPHAAGFWCLSWNNVA